MGGQRNNDLLSHKQYILVNIKRFVGWININYTH